MKKFIILFMTASSLFISPASANGDDDGDYCFGACDNVIIVPELPVPKLGGEKG